MRQIRSFAPQANLSLDGIEPEFGRLARATNDPGKERLRAWLMNLDDAQLSSGLGLALKDIIVLRGGSLALSGHG